LATLQGNWAENKLRGYGALFAQRSVVTIDELEPFERLKLRILSLGRAVHADEWLEPSWL
jgi:hypothetical protein